MLNTATRHTNLIIGAACLGLAMLISFIREHQRGLQSATVACLDVAGFIGAIVGLVIIVSEAINL